MGGLGGEDYFCPVDEEERHLTSGPTCSHLDPSLATFLEPIEGSCLEPLENLRICLLHLPVAMSMSNRSKAELDPDFLAVLSEGIAGELRAIVSDYAVGDFEVENNSMDELDCYACGDLGNVYGFSPLGELVDGDEQVLVAPDYLGERSQDIQPLDHERP